MIMKFFINTLYTYEAIFSPGKQNGDPILVINSNFWKSHFLSGEKKRVPPGGHGLAWLIPASAGGKKRVPQIESNPGSGPALAAHPKTAKHQKTLAKQCKLGNVEILVAAKTHRNL